MPKNNSSKNFDRESISMEESSSSTQPKNSVSEESTLKDDKSKEIMMSISEIKVKKKRKAVEDIDEEPPKKRFKMSTGLKYDDISDISEIDTQKRSKNVANVLRNQFNLDKLKVEQNQLDFNLDILYNAKDGNVEIDAYSFNEEINNGELTAFIQNYNNNDSFLYLDVLYLKSTDEIFSSQGLPSFTKIYHLYHLADLKNTTLFETTRCQDSTDLYGFNTSILETDSYIVLFGTKAGVYSFMFQDKYSESTFRFFIRKTILSLRSQYFEIPELINLDILVNEEQDLQTLIRIYFYLRMIENATARWKKLIIVDQILQLLNKRDILRRIIKNDFVSNPNLYVDLIRVGYYFLTKSERDYLHLQFIKNADPKLVSKSILWNSSLKINHKILIVLIVKLAPLLNENEGEFRRLLEDFKNYNNKCSPEKIIKLSTIIYNFLTYREENLDELYLIED
ncbi:hypothetical protein NGRA_2605 [Nosema granulosis]|uniref:Uncharacterized protein n=1 Tax=Nosema granulosis TaxID=83296 RepID=A0A9P6GXD5_9MICR|nr:hypothetical protein NGRA_2605 [Nosema granulosis]